MSVLLFFIDGFGLGKKDKSNPLYKFELWNHIIGDALTTTQKVLKKNYALIPTDAHLGFNGTPQSATGQTCLFTGENAIKLIGGHLTGFPGEELTQMLLDHSIFKKLKERGFKAISANAYSTDYFERVKKKKALISASTVSIQAADIPFKMLDDLQKGDAVFMDITHHLLRERYPEIKEIPSSKAAKNMVNILKKHHFVMYEYFWTDMLGHKGTYDEKKIILKNLSIFLKTLVKNLNLKKDTIIICSDHGNIEDGINRGHTDNLVPTLVFSKRKDVLKYFYKEITDLCSVPNSILRGFNDGLLK